MLYFPPKHPRGLDFKQALRELDYIGGVLFILAGTLVLTGIVYTTILPASSPKVIGTLCSGFATLIGFCLYEHFGNPKQPLTPTRIFTKDKGREFTFPFIVGFVVTMFYYMTNIVHPTQIAVLWTNETTPLSTTLKYSLPSNLGLVFGEILLMIFGTRLAAIVKWKWTLTGSVFLMVLFGALLGMGTQHNKGMMFAFAFISQTGFGWAQMLSIAFIQFGAPQVELGIAGGLAGVSRFAGGAIAISVYTTISKFFFFPAVRLHTLPEFSWLTCSFSVSNVQATWAAKLIPAAATGAGLPTSSLPALVKALPLGSAALAKVPGITMDIMLAAGAAVQQSYIHALKVTALSSLSFGVIAIIACALCNDIGPKMTSKIEVFLENDEFADRNVYH